MSIKFWSVVSEPLNQFLIRLINTGRALEASRYIYLRETGG